jgi:uncharacterized protein (TIGR03435 family)
MEKLRSVFPVRRNRLLSTVGLFAVAVTLAFVLVNSTPGVAQSQTQGAAAAAPTTLPVYEYDVVSIKPNKSGSLIPGGRQSDVGIDVSNFPLQFLIAGAFGVGLDRIAGLPGWVSSDRFDINARMDPAVVDAIKKLSADDRKIVQQNMLQALFADRCKLKFHRETKELSTLTLVLGKNGPKFKESKPGETPEGGIKVPDGKGGTGSMLIGEKGLISFRGLPITFLVQILSSQLGTTIVDKTGLTGKYDFSWQFTPTQAQIRAFGGATPPSEGGSGGAGSVLPDDPDGASLYSAVQEQLGLKLESGKGPVEIIVIDHIEKPSDN